MSRRREDRGILPLGLPESAGAPPVRFCEDALPLPIPEHHPPYPEAPGAKREGPSAEAAKSLDQEHIDALQRDILRVIGQSGALTTDDVAALLQVDRYRVRPRMSELVAMGLLEDSGERGQNVSGRPATLWKLTPHQHGEEAP